MKPIISWSPLNRGGGMVSCGFKSNDGVVFWFVLSRTRIGKRVFYLKMLKLRAGKSPSEQRIYSVETDESVTQAVHNSKKFIKDTIKFYKAKRTKGDV